MLRTKERIFETALNLFAANGFKATSIRDITRETGLSVAAFYNHFKSKNELLQSIYDYYTGLYQGNHDAGPDFVKLLDQMNPCQLFEYLNRQIIESMLNEKLVKLTRVIVNEQYTNQTAAAIAFKDRQLLLSSMEKLFIAMNQKGLIKVSDPAAWGRLVGFMYLGFASDNIHYSILGASDPHEIVGRQTGLVWSLLREIVSG
jgi:AcrR family transcriptional regulator